MHSVVSQALCSMQAVGGISKVMFVACGGSLAAFYPAKFLLEKESKQLRVGYYPANEFVHATPQALDQNTLVVGCSHGGTTQETVAAMRLAKERGAATVSFTFTPESAITAWGDQVVKYTYGPGTLYSRKQNALGLRLAMELLWQLEEWPGYQAGMQSFERFDRMAHQAEEHSLPAAKAFALANRDEKVIYTVGSGACWGAAYTECVCILMEMQSIHSNCIHAGEFFHGPLEITDGETPFLVMMGDGSTRDLDQRALSFLRQWSRKVYPMDVKELGINVLDNAVVEYFAPLLLTVVVEIYNQQLAEARQHPLSARRYMWRVPY